MIVVHHTLRKGSFVKLHFDRAINMAHNFAIYLILCGYQHFSRPTEGGREHYKSLFVCVLLATINIATYVSVKVDVGLPRN